MIEQNSYAVGQLKKLKDQRFDLAHRDLVNAKQALASAEEALNKAEQALASYRMFRKQQKDQLYAEFQSQQTAVYLKDIYQLNQALMSLKAKEMTHEQQVAKRLEAKKKADENLSFAWVQFAKSQKALEKIAFVQDHVQEKLGLVEQKKQEAEDDEIGQMYGLHSSPKQIQ